MGKSSVAHFINSGRTLLIRSPVILLLVLMVMIFNHFFSSTSVDLKRGVTGIALFGAIKTATNQLYSPLGLIVAFFTANIAVVISMFEAQSLLAVFTNKPHPIKIGFIRIFRSESLIFLAIYILLIWSYSVCVTAMAEFIVIYMGAIGIIGGLSICLVCAVTFPVIFALLSMATTVLSLDLENGDLLLGLRLTLSVNNLTILVIFYLIRIGIEIVAIGFFTETLIWAGVSPIVAASVALAALFIPIALIRTSSLLLKIQILTPLASVKRMSQDNSRDAANAVL